MGTAIVLACLGSACERPLPAKPHSPTDRMEVPFEMEGGTSNHPYDDLVVPSPNPESPTSPLSPDPPTDQKMRVLPPNSQVDHKIRTVQADPNIDYKIRTLGPSPRKAPAHSNSRREPEPPNTAHVPAKEPSTADR